MSLTTAVCPNCNAYRFDSNTEYVVEQAVLLASREQRSVTPEDLENYGVPPGAVFRRIPVSLFSSPAGSATAPFS